MPVTKSAKKARRQSLKAFERKKRIKENLKRLLKTVSEDNLTAVISAVDKAAKVRVISKARAARIKSRLSRQFPAVFEKKSSRQKSAKTQEKK